LSGALSAVSGKTGLDPGQLVGISAGIATIGLALQQLPGPVTSASAVMAGLGAVFEGIYLELATAPTLFGGLIAILGGPMTAAIIAVTAIVAAFGLAYATNFLGIQDISLAEHPSRLCRRRVRVYR
jgi:hypothetical protein